MLVWELQGFPETWGAQIAEDYRREPVFAVISGLSNTTWAPVHEFCQREQVPCLFPNIPLPPLKEAFYGLYFSRGVALEADVLAKHLLDPKNQRPQRVVQVFRNNEAGRGAAQALTHALTGSGIALEERTLREGDPGGLDDVLKAPDNQSIFMFWLRPADLAALNKAAPSQPPAAAYFSALMAEGGYGAIPAEWKPRVRLVYPYEIGDKRRSNLAPLMDGSLAGNCRWLTKPRRLRSSST